MDVGSGGVWRQYISHSPTRQTVQAYIISVVTRDIDSLPTCSLGQKVLLGQLGALSFNHCTSSVGLHSYNGSLVRSSYYSSTTLLVSAPTRLNLLCCSPSSSTVGRGDWQSSLERLRNARETTPFHDAGCIGREDREYFGNRYHRSPSSAIGRVHRSWLPADNLWSCVHDLRVTVSLMMNVIAASIQW